MKEILNKKEETEGTYEQFDTDETFPQENKKINIFLSKKLIKYILVTFVFLCFILLLLNLTQFKNISNNLEFKSNPKKLKLPLEKDELSIKNEIKLIVNKINLVDSVKGLDIINGIHQTILINVFIKINNICSKDNCFDCYKNNEINYPELSEKEAFDKVYKEMNLRNTFIKNIYCQKHNPKMPKGDYSNQIHFVWNNYKRKMIPINGLYYLDEDIANTYNNEYLQAVIQGYKFTFMDHIYAKVKKFYKYNDKALKFDEIKFN